MLGSALGPPRRRAGRATRRPAPIQKIRGIGLDSTPSSSSPTSPSSRPRRKRKRRRQAKEWEQRREPVVAADVVAVVAVVIDAVAVVVVDAVDVVSGFVSRGFRVSLLGFFGFGPGAEFRVWPSRISGLAPPVDFGFGPSGFPVSGEFPG